MANQNNQNNTNGYDRVVKSKLFYPTQRNQQIRLVHIDGVVCFPDDFQIDGVK